MEKIRIYFAIQISRLSSLYLFYTATKNPKKKKKEIRKMIMVIENIQKVVNNHHYQLLLFFFCHCRITQF